MTAALVSMGIGLLYSWVMMALEWNWYSFSRGRWGERRWILLGLSCATLFWAWRAWAYWA